MSGMNVPGLIRDARRRAALTQTELAERSGTSQATISAYEHGAKTPTPATLARVLAAAGMPASEPASPLAALPDAIARDETTAAAIARDGQIRLWWDDTPIVFFFSYEPLHNEAARNRRAVLLEGEGIPILGPVELAVFKTIFDRTRDWADVEAMLDAGNLDADAVRDRLIALVGRDDDRLGETLRRGPGGL